MKFANPFGLRAVAAASLLVIGVGANAATLEFNDSVALSTTSWTLASLGETLELSKFNTSLGTLTGVTLSVTGLTNVTFGADSNDGADYDMSVTAKTVYAISGGGVNLGGSKSGTAATFSATADTDGGVADYAGTDGFTTSDAYTYTKSVNVVSGLWSNFTGVGMVSFAASASGSLVLDVPSNYDSFSDHKASAAVKVVYTYTPASTVPEPEGYALMLAGLAAVGAMSRRRRVG